MKMIQAGKLVPIEEALASLAMTCASAPSPPKPGAMMQPAMPRPVAAPPQKTAAPAPVAAAGPPSPDDDWREKLQSAMVQAGLQFSADAMGHASAALVNNQLTITAPKQFTLDLGREEIQTALKQLGYPALRFNIVLSDVKPAGAPIAAKAAPKPAAQDEVTEHALGHPEVQRFRELFGGEVRNVRNLKES